MASPRLLKTVNFHWSTIETVDRLRGKQSYADWFAADPRLTGIVDPPVQPVAVPPPAAPVSPPPVASPPRATMKDLFGQLDPATGKVVPRRDWLLRRDDGTVENHSLTRQEAEALADSLCGEDVNSVSVPHGEGFQLWYDGNESDTPSATLFPA